MGVTPIAQSDDVTGAIEYLYSDNVGSVRLAVGGHAVKALRKLKVQAARPGLERMLGDDRAWVRKEAQRALAALD